MGVEPTAARSARPASGFEDRGSHRATTTPRCYDSGDWWIGQLVDWSIGQLVAQLVGCHLTRYRLTNSQTWI